MNTQQKRKLGRTLLVALAAAGAIEACGKDNNAPVDAPVVGNGGASGTGGKGGSGKGTGGTAGTAGTDNPGGDGAGGSSGTGGSSGKGGSAGKGGSTGKGGVSGTGTGADGGTGNEGGTDGGDCVQNPTHPEDFLVRCTDSRCAPFDNFTRISGFNGTLPDL